MRFRQGVQERELAPRMAGRDPARLQPRPPPTAAAHPSISLNSEAPRRRPAKQPEADMPAPRLLLYTAAPAGQHSGLRLPVEATPLLQLKRSFSATTASATAFRSCCAGTNCCRWPSPRRSVRGELTSLRVYTHVHLYT
uniref:Uncharacterized protein n=1 Tax=Oryza punctata TaxID=4537 RepID=A0A0E0JEE7_ORYPU